MDKGTGQPDFLEVLRQTSVRSTSVSTPGVGFGPSGEGYVRLTLSANATNAKKVSSEFVSACKQNNL